MTKVKICGLKRVEHVTTAVQANADFIGFVFAPSKRQISIEAAKALAAYIPAHVKKVGVFVNASKEYIIEAQKEVGLDYIQYHGDESPAFIQAIGLPAIKAFSMDESLTEQDILKYPVDFYLLDAPPEEYRGGNGRTFNWELVRSLSIPSSKIILAGGLNADNVQEAIKFVQPYAVDVSSGVEINKIKSSTLIKQFIGAAKGVAVHE